MTASKHQGGGPRPSLLAVTLCLCIVAGAVLFGVFGPGIAQRSQLGGRITLGELVAAAAALNDGFLGNALRSRVPSIAGDGESNEPPTKSVVDAIHAAVGVEAEVPDLGASGFRLASANPVALRGTEPDAFALSYLSSNRRRAVTVVLVPDDGRAFIFDDFGRPTALEPGRLVQEPLGRTARDESVALVWSDGSLLHIAIVPSEDEAAAMRSALGAP